MSFSGTKGYLTKPKPGILINPMHPLSKGLVGYWLFNEGSGNKAYDISGKGNHGTLKNMSTNAQGSGWGGSKFGGRIEYDGVNDYIEVNNKNSIDFANEDFSYVFWIKMNIADVANAKIINKGTSSGGCGLGKRYEVYLTITTSEIEFAIDDDITKSYWEGPFSDYIDGTWHQAVFTRDTKANELKVYLDDAQNGETIIDATGSISNSCPLLFGTSSDVAATYPKCSLDLIRFYSRVLLAEEVKQLYHDPFCNLLQVPIRRYSVAAPPVGAIMNQFQRANIGADLYNGAIII